MSARRNVRPLPVKPEAPALGERLWTVEETSAWLGVPVNTLYGWRSRSLGPPASRLGRHLRYAPEHVRAWVERQVS